jgi:hypothetical protein
MKFLEVFGINKIEEYYKKIENRNKNAKKYFSIESLFSSSHLKFMVFLAFLIGFGLTIPLIWLELKLDIFNFSSINYLNLTIYLFSLTILIFLEFYLLFILGFYTIAYIIYHLKYFDEMHISAITQCDFLALFSRTIMELPEEKEKGEKFNINHHELSNKDLLIFSLFYKMKVVASNFILKFLSKRILTRSSFRVYSPYIAAVGTGAWDAFVFHKTIKHAKYKIMVRYTIQQLIVHKKSLITNEHNIKAILARYHHYSEYNNNLSYLLSTISQYTEIDYTKDDYLDEKTYIQCNKNLLILLFSFKESIHNKYERKLINSIASISQIKVLRTALSSGDIKYINTFINSIED